MRHLGHFASSRYYSVHLPAPSGNITPSLIAARTSGVAPLSVFFDASATTASSLTSKPFHDLVYVWSFGDNASLTWTNGSRTGLSKNVAFGPVAAHIFETAGTFTATLTVFHYSSLGVMSSGSASQTITVTAADTVFASNTVCFSTSGTFTGAPAGATLITTSNYDTAIATYKGTKKRLLFRGGETFTATSSPRLDVTGPGIIGSFGTGSAKWNISGTNTALVLSSASTPTISDWRIMDLEMAGANVESSSGVDTQGGFDQVLCLRLNVHDVTSGIGFASTLLDYWNANGSPGHHIWDQLSVVECRVNNIDSGIPYGISGSGGGIGSYIGAERFAFIGNDYDVKGGGEHVLRTPYVGKGVISNNIFANPNPAKHCYKLHAPKQNETGTTGGGRFSEKIVISDNTMYGGTTAEVFVIGPQNTDSDERLRDIIVERNYLISGSGVVFVFKTYGSVSYLTIRNNIINCNLGATNYGTVYGINLDSTPLSPGGPTLTLASIDNNTIYKTAGPDSMSAILLTASPVNVRVSSNLIYSTVGGSVISGGGGAGYSATNNSTTISTNPLFSSVPTNTALQLSATDFKIGASSYAKDSGAYVVGVYRDFQNVTRTLPADMGAVQA